MNERRILCERARGWAALQPDGELSTFEQRLLGAHLDRCAECRAFAARIDAVTDAVRSAPLEPLAHPVSIGSVLHGARRILPRRAVYSVAATAAAAAFALTIGSAVSVSGGERFTTSPPPIVVVVEDPDERREVRDMRQLRRVQLVSDIRPETSSRAYHFGASAGL
jgi:anti-sigma factor RsiW